MILLNDFSREHDDLGKDWLQRTADVFASGNYILGEYVKLFEDKFAVYCQRKWAVGVGNGMDAIEIGLRALGLKVGDKVLTTPLTAFATTLAIFRAGGIPVFVDVDGQGNLDLDRAEEVLSKDKTIKFMVPVHLYGIPLNLLKLKLLKKSYKLIIVEDCAQAIGASYGDSAIGTVGDLAAFSFYPTKNLGALGDGGAIIGDSDRLKKVVKTLRNYGQSDHYVHTMTGLNSRLDELQAGLLELMLNKRLDRYTRRRRQIADFYYSHLLNQRIRLPAIETASQPVWHLFPVIIEGDRERFRKYCLDNKLQTGIHYPLLVSEQQAMKQIPHQVNGNLHQAQVFASQEVSIPIHPYLTDEELEKVAKVIQAYT
jgi:dTDP-3-amino-3,4,6-trideoxy-alpha-D-glucose transaminase